MLDPDRTSHWFSLGSRALVECDQMMVLQSVAEVSIKIINTQYLLYLEMMPLHSQRRVYNIHS